jgi:hypothetical protein
MAFHRIHFLANETPSSKSLNHFIKNHPNIKIFLAVFESSEVYPTSFSVSYQPFQCL